MADVVPKQKDLKEIIREEYMKCVADPVHFMSKYCFVQHPIRGKVPFVLYPFQVETLKDFKEYDYNIVLKSRQLGISTLVAAYALWLMMFNSDKNILVIATKQDVAKNMVTKVRVMQQNLPSWLKNVCIEDNKLSLRFKNGSQIKAVSSSPDAGRSEALSLLIVDEAAFIEYIDEIWAAAQQTLATGGRAILLSTPNGVNNFFHKMWIGAENKLNKFHPIKLKWDVHPERNQGWRDEQDQVLGVRIAAQECDADFITSGNTVISSEILKFYVDTYQKDPLEKRGIDSGLWIWQYPDLNRSYIASADVSRGDGEDYSALQILDIDTLEQVAEYRGKIGTTEFGNLCVNVATEYNTALLVIENASIGWHVAQVAIDRNYSNIFYSNKELNVVDTYVTLGKRMDLKERSQLVVGFTTSQRTRPLIISKLESYMRNKEIPIRSKRLLEELYTFVWVNNKPEHTSGYNDDTILAYSIGLWVRDTAVRLRSDGIELQKVAVSHISVNKPSPILIPEQRTKNTWKMPLIGGQSEDLTNWL